MSSDTPRVIGHANTSVKQQRQGIPWLWEGVLATGAVTLLSAPEKSGKTTLLSLLLDRLRAGGELLGRTVYPAKAIVCSEENSALWALRQPPLDFGADLLFHCPVGPIPSRGRWKRFFNDVLALCFPDPNYDILVIDTAVNFLPLTDRNKRTLRWAISTLCDFAQIPLAVLVLNQSRNVHRPLAASADIVIEMTVPRTCSPPSHREKATSSCSLPSPSGRAVGGDGNRRRTFTGVGRYPGTLQSVTAALNAEGTDYVLLDANPTPHAPLFCTLQNILAQNPTPLTRNDILEHWPAPAPHPDSLYRTLARGLQLGLFTATGQGTKSDPYRFASTADEVPHDIAIDGQSTENCSAKEQ